MSSRIRSATSRGCKELIVWNEIFERGELEEWCWYWQQDPRNNLRE